MCFSLFLLQLHGSHRRKRFCYCCCIFVTSMCEYWYAIQSKSAMQWYANWILWISAYFNWCRYGTNTYLYATSIINWQIQNNSGNSNQLLNFIYNWQQ